MDNNIEPNKPTKCFNWGAAALGLFWSVSNECFKKWFKAFLLITIIPTLLAIFGPIIYMIITQSSGWQLLGNILFMLILLIVQQLVSLIVLFVFAGIKGNQWAFDSGKFSDIEQYNHEQKLWAKVAGIFLLSILIIILMTTTFCCCKIHNKKLEHINEYRNQCAVFNDILPPIFAEIKDNIDVSSFMTALKKNPRIKQEIPKPYYISNSGYYTLVLKIDTNTDSKYITYKYLIYNQNKNCNIKNTNCYVELEKKYKKDLENVANCKFYFDYSGKVVPSKNTLEFINGAK